MFVEIEFILSVVLLSCIYLLSYFEVCVIVLVYRYITGHSLEKRDKALYWVTVFGTLYLYITYAGILVGFYYFPEFGLRFWFGLLGLWAVWGMIIFLFVDPIEVNPNSEELAYMRKNSINGYKYLLTSFLVDEFISYLEQLYYYFLYLVIIFVDKVDKDWVLSMCTFCFVIVILFILYWYFW